MASTWLLDLESTCSALGTWDGANYVKEEDCLECLKDLIRFVSRNHKQTYIGIGKTDGNFQKLSLHLAAMSLASKGGYASQCSLQEGKNIWRTGTNPTHLPNQIKISKLEEEIREKCALID